jgi:hypothetical protein
MAATTKKARAVKKKGKTVELREAPKRAGSTAKPSAAGRYSTQVKKAP